MESVPYGGWPNCVKLSNGSVELVATTDVGPRIIRFGFVGQDNEFFEDAGQLGKTGGDEWKSYGGHRLWHAPESKPRTYFPDNAPVKHKMVGQTLRLTQAVEPTTGIEKEIDITLDRKANHVTLIHKLTNRNLWPIEMAPWALSQMAPGGEAIFPQEPYAPHPDFPDFSGQKTDQKHFVPSRTMALWSYTNLADPRWTFTSKYIVLKQDVKLKKPQKIGFSNREDWGAYARNGHLFVKTSAYQSGATYPDGGCSFESFVNADLLEVETLGPMVKLAPGATITHREDWYLFEGVQFENTDESIDAKILPKVKSVLRP